MYLVVKPDGPINAMGESPGASRVFIVSQTSLFAQGIRSLLRGSKSIEIIGLESDPTKAIKAVRTLQPNVVIVETSLGAKEQSVLDVLLHSQTPMRLVALDLEQNHAMVCDPHTVVTTRAKDLVEAIRGVGKRQQLPVPNQIHPKASMLLQPASGRGGDEGRSGRKSRVRRTQKQGTEISDRLPRTSRGSGKGG